MKKLNQNKFACLLPGILSLVWSARLSAQPAYKTNVELQCLRSTHGNNFRGTSVAVDKSISVPLSIGLGIEYTYTPTHLDNGWNLSNLNFLPVYAEERWQFKPLNATHAFVHFSEGISFMRYDKSIPDSNVPKHTLHESGFYGYAGLGLLWKLGRRNHLLTELGIKSFKITTNNLDVNPHGLTFRMGLAI
ncbi:hypothetical protein [Flavihumibacter fluvii]|uniref:hypothetical protein n=1 Tax=Flavihumibacter fluvii TaxID=2838157 RepID=UPI001BDEC4B1|nr:hypothetical protein [Flavihumibacter fluvii]ULQ51050.1 hypothetical protein KJS93_13245 [Flavihumibacter fluvii]